MFASICIYIHVSIHPGGLIRSRFGSSYLCVLVCHTRTTWAQHRYLTILSTPCVGPWRQLLGKWREARRGTSPSLTCSIHLWGQAGLLTLRNCSDEDVVHIVNALENSPFSREQVHALFDRVHAVRSETRTVQRGRRPNQKCLNFENFIPDVVWARAKTARVDTVAVNDISTTAHSMLLVNACEPTLDRMARVVGYMQGWTNIDSDQTRLTSTKLSIQNKLHRMGKKIPKDTPYLEEYIPVHIIRSCVGTHSCLRTMSSFELHTIP